MDSKLREITQRSQLLSMQTSGQGTTPIQVGYGSLLKQSELRRSFNLWKGTPSLEKIGHRPALETMRMCILALAKEKSPVLDGEGRRHVQAEQRVGGGSFQVVSVSHLDFE